MHKNIFNGWATLENLIVDNGLSDSFLFSPFGGLGDRLTYYAYLESYSTLYNRKVKILNFGDKVDELIKFFPYFEDKIAIINPDPIVKPLNATHWVYGYPFPDAGKVYFTWHFNYLDGNYARMFEHNCHEDSFYNHKNLIKLILNLPLSTTPSQIVVDYQAPDNNCILICPISNTIQSISNELWRDIAYQLKALGFRVIINVDKNIDLVNKQRLTEFDEFETFTGSLTDLLKLAASCQVTLSSRNGLCELLSLAKIRYIQLEPKPSLPFWHLMNFGVGPIYKALVDTQEQIPKVVKIIQSLPKN